LKFWQALAFSNVDQLEALAVHAEALGFHGVCLADHLVTTKSQVDTDLDTDHAEVIWQAETHWPDPFVQMAALAKVTTTLRFMTSVYVLPMRDAFSVAKSVATVAHISGSRVVLGVGGGWMRTEFDLLGRSFETRGRHMDEQLAVIERLWRGGMVEHHGEFYDFEPLQMSPAPPAKIPIWVGGHAPAALRRAGRHDGWAGMAYPFEDIEAMVGAVKAARLEVAGKLDDYEIILCCTDLQPEHVPRLEAMGVTGLVKDAWLENGEAAVVSLEAKIADLDRFAARYL
jgi:probable F420-dependent oxidoreductase